jgi:hypothetical protein
MNGRHAEVGIPISARDAVRLNGLIPDIRINGVVGVNLWSDLFIFYGLAEIGSIVTEQCGLRPTPPFGLTFDRAMA